MDDKVVLHPAGAAILIDKVCEMIVKQPTRSHILYLKEMICVIPSSTIQRMHKVLFPPLVHHLMNNQLGLEVKRYLVDCMKEVVQRTHMYDLKEFLMLYSLIFLQVYERKNAQLIGDFPEELKLAVINCVTCLLKQSSSDVISELYDKKYTPKLGQGIYICIQIARWEKLHSLRLAALECLMTHAQVHNEADKNDIVLRHQVGDVLMSVLPGIACALQSIATEDEKQGHQITLLAVRAWGEIIAIVMEDTNVSLNVSDQLLMEPVVPTKEDPLINVWKNDTVESKEKNLEEMSRTAEWYHAAAEKLAISVQALTKVQRHSHWKVRMELASTFTFLLSKCCRNLKPAIPYLIEVLIMLSEDENENIAVTSKNGLKMFSEKYELESGKSLLEVLEENFYNLVTSLPRILHGTNDEQQLAALRLLSGYIKILGIRKLPQLLSSAAHLNRLVMTLIQAFELENSSVTLLEEYSLRDFEVNHVGQNVPWKKFKHFTDNNILMKMEDICNLLGQYGDLNILSYHLLDMFHSALHHRKEVTLLLNEILTGGSTRKDLNLDHIIRNVLRVYLEPSVWYASITVRKQENEEETNVTVGEAQNNVLQACLLVEGIGKMVKAYGQKFDHFLLQTLYLVFERAGSAHELIAEAGMKAIQDIACACGHGNNITDLIKANVDYFSYHITCRLRRVEQHPGVLDVLSIVMKYSTMDVLPCLEEIVQDVLLQSHDASQDGNAVPFLRVFYVFVLSVKRWMENNNIDDDVRNSTLIHTSEIETSDPTSKVSESSQVVNYITKYHTSKMESKDFSDFDKNTFNERVTLNNELNDVCDSENSDSEVKEGKKLPLHIKMIVAVLERSLHFLPTKRREQKLLVLLILKEGLLILDLWEDELLPVVHKIWSPFVNRFNEMSDPLIVNRSFSLLCVLAQTAKDFIRPRTVKEVLPSLCNFLSRSATESKRKDKGSSYRFTQLFKLQKELLNNMGDLSIHLKLNEKETDQVIVAAAPYLSSLQPLPLQESCLKLFQKLVTLNCGAVWLKMINIWSPVQQFEPVVDGLHIIKVNKTSLHQEEFKKNVQEILSCINIEKRMK